MDIPPPPPPPPSGDIPPPPGAQPPGAQPADAAPVDAQPAGAQPVGPPPYGAHPAGPLPPPPPPPPPGAGSPYGAGPPYGPPPPYPQGPYGQQRPQYGPGPGAPTPYPGLPPYGAPGPYGYPAQPQGWYVERPTNGLAIASLVTALTCIPLLGLILGLFGLRQIRRRGDRGKGLAVAGVTINSVWTLAAAALTVLAVVGVVTQGNTRVRDLTAGDCFNTVHSSLSDYGGAGTPSTTVDVVSCDTAHDAEAYKVFALDPGPSGGYPGADAIARSASAQCDTYADDYLGGSQRPSGLHIYYFMPPADGWYRGDQSVICFFGSPTGKVSGSAKTAGNATGVGV